jgi:hypothetical protein
MFHVGIFPAGIFPAQHHVCILNRHICGCINPNLEDQSLNEMFYPIIRVVNLQADAITDSGNHCLATGTFDQSNLPAKFVIFLVMHSLV